MDGKRNRYLMVVPVPAHRIDDQHFAIESAFAVHLRVLRSKLGSLAEELVLAAPALEAADYDRDRAHLAIVDEGAEHIRFRPMFPAGASRLKYVAKLPGILRRLYREVKHASVVHASTSQLYRPFEFPALLMARVAGKKSISVTDIDRRENARMNLEAGVWNWRRYFTTRLLHDPFERLQHRICARICSLVLLKGTKLADDYGRGRPNVKPFLDSAYSEGQIIDSARLEEKIGRLRDPHTPIDLTYFGRLTEYKGVDHMLRAMAHARARGLDAFHFHVIGAGEAEAAYRAVAQEQGLMDVVTFHGPRPFGPKLFDQLYRYHLLLAAPLRQDTPRSALDAMASGQAIIAYDTYYYDELATAGAPVHLVPWRDERAFADKLLAICSDRDRLARSLRRAVAFSRDHTQEVWLDRRVRWTQEACAS